MNQFKFFQKKPERIFTQWMDEMDDYHLGGIRRPNRPIDETYPEYYNTDEFVFFDVTEIQYDEVDGYHYKVMLFRHIEEGNTVEGQRIYSNHPMYNFPDII